MDPRAAEHSDEDPGDVHSEATGTAKPSATEPVEIGGPNRLEPTRYGDWEKNGRCIDF